MDNMRVDADAGPVIRVALKCLLLTPQNTSDRAYDCLSHVNTPTDVSLEPVQTSQQPHSQAPQLMPRQQTVHQTLRQAQRRVQPLRPILKAPAHQTARQLPQQRLFQRLAPAVLSSSGPSKQHLKNWTQPLD